MFLSELLIGAAHTRLPVSPVIVFCCVFSSFGYSTTCSSFHVSVVLFLSLHFFSSPEEKKPVEETVEWTEVEGRGELPEGITANVLAVHKAWS